MTLVKLSDVKVGTEVFIAVNSEIRRGKVVKQTFKQGYKALSYTRPDKIYTTVRFVNEYNRSWNVPFMHSNQRMVLLEEVSPNPCATNVTA